MDVEMVGERWTPGCLEVPSFPYYKSSDRKAQPTLPGILLLHSRLEQVEQVSSSAQALPISPNYQSRDRVRPPHWDGTDVWMYQVNAVLVFCMYGRGDVYRLCNFLLII